MRRLIALLVFFLFLGAIVNVAVTWGCAAWVPMAWNSPATRDEFTGWDTAHGFDPQKRFDGYFVASTRRFGALQIYISGQNCGFDGSPLPTTAAFQDLVPSWSHAFLCLDMSRQYGDPYTGDEVVYAIIDARGLPFLSMWGAVDLPVEWSGGGRPEGRSHGIILLERLETTLSSEIGRWLPLIPLWPGFLLNTAFYTAILWSLWFTPGVIRRALRRRRNLCPACAYPIGASPTCTECGVLITRRAPP